VNYERIERVQAPTVRRGGPRNRRLLFPHGVAWQRRQICEYAFMRTTVDLPDALFKRVKSEAALRGMRLREFIAQALEQSLAGHRDDLKSRRVRLPLIRSGGGPPINLTREQVDAGIWE
jgi:hypothetical protein